MYTILQYCRLTHPLFDMCFELPSLFFYVGYSTRAEYHYNSFIQEKMYEVLGMQGHGAVQLLLTVDVQLL